MVFLADGKRIEIKAVYSWFDIYINYTMVLHHISKSDADDIISSIIKANGKQIA